MSAIEWSDVTAIASELEEVELAAQTAILEFVNGFLNPQMFTTTNLKNARRYLAAHIGTFSMPEASGLGSGDVVSESVGGLSRTYGTIAASTRSDGLDETSYGSIYAMILRTSKARLPRVI